MIEWRSRLRLTFFFSIKNIMLNYCHFRHLQIVIYYKSCLMTRLFHGGCLEQQTCRESREGWKRKLRMQRESPRVRDANAIRPDTSFKQFRTCFALILKKCWEDESPSSSFHQSASFRPIKQLKTFTLQSSRSCTQPNPTYSYYIPLLIGARQIFWMSTCLEVDPNQI